MIKCIIFDMDGLLVNSEPLWREAEKTVFKNIGTLLTDEMCRSVMGLRVDEVMQHWCKQFDIKNLTPKELENQVVEKVIQLIEAKAEAMCGVNQILNFFTQKKLKIALASSSVMKVIQAVVDSLKIAPFFNKIHSAEYEKFGKPHPDIFIHTAQYLNVMPSECLVFEDSLNGILAAKAARMKVVAVPENFETHDKRFIIADLIIKSLDHFTNENLEMLNKL